jgi:hypothetical protein
LRKNVANERFRKKKKSRWQNGFENLKPMRQIVSQRRKSHSMRRHRRLPWVIADYILRTSSLAYLRLQQARDPRKAASGRGTTCPRTKVVRAEKARAKEVRVTKARAKEATKRQTSRVSVMAAMLVAPACLLAAAVLELQRILQQPSEFVSQVPVGIGRKLALARAKTVASSRTLTPRNYAVSIARRECHQILRNARSCIDRNRHHLFHRHRHRHRRQVAIKSILVLLHQARRPPTIRHTRSRNN